MKKILALMLALLMMLSLVACSDEEKNEGGDGIDMTVTSTDQYFSVGGDYDDQYKYEYINGNQVAITGFTSSHVPHAITIPTTINDRPVVEISSQAFYNCKRITSVTIPEGITKIGNLAFSDCTVLTTVTLPSTLASIGNAAFSGCTLLAAPTFGNNITSIGYAAFYNCKSLKNVVLPDSVTVIADQLFMKCDNLQTVSFGNAVTKIGAHAFSSCKKLNDIVDGYPATLTEVGEYAFSNCESLAAPDWAKNENDGITVGDYAYHNTLKA